MKKLISVLLCISLLLFCFLNVSFAHEEVTTTETHHHYFHHGDGVVGSLFYFIGDVIALPFRLLGALFDAVF